LVEFALVAPFLLLLILGAAQVGLLVYDYLAIGTAAREGARIGTENPQNSGVFPSPPKTLTPACTKTTVGNPVCTAVFNAANNSSGLGLIDTGHITAVVSSTAPAAANPCPLTGAASGYPNDGFITVQVKYPVPIFVPLIGQVFADSNNSGQRTVSASVTMRIEPCSMTQGN
jgi:Flp pilus assembly protein TadG